MSGPQHLLAATLLSAVLITPNAYSQNNDNNDILQEPDNSGWSLHMDNDLFTPRKHDRDYTGGLSLTLAGRRISSWPVSLDPALTQVNRWLGIDDPEVTHLHSLQVGIAAFSPEDISNPELNRNDRPYASLLYLANSQVQLLDERTAIQTTFTVGVLGSPAAEYLQKGIHNLTQSDPPQGWRHQIARGGEPTLRYTYAYQRLMYQQPGQLEIKHSSEGSAGFLTEANSAVSLRWGRIKTPWWSFTPDRSEYFAQPTIGLPTGNGVGHREIYLWAGAKIRVRAYNAFLQGQFRDSALSYNASEVRPVLLESWLGLTRQLSEHYRLSWVWRYQSSELKEGHGDRDLVWGSFIVNRDF